MATAENEDAASPSAARPFVASLKEAVIAAVVAVVLSIPLLALHARNSGSQLDLVFRWYLVPIAAGLTFCGRLLLAFVVTRRRLGDGRTATRSSSGGGVFRKRISALRVPMVVVGIVIAILFPFVFPSSVAIYVVTTFLLYAMLGLGLNVVVGLAGLLDLGYVAFYAIGAYFYALVAVHFGWSFWQALIPAAACSGLFGVLLGFPVLRLRGDYLAIVTLGFGEIVRLMLLNWSSLTGGPDGVWGIPTATFFGVPFTRAAGGFSDVFGLQYNSLHLKQFLYFLILALVALVVLFVRRLRKLPVGQAWEALREDEIASRSLGLNPTNVMLSAFAIGATIGGLGGAFFAARTGAVSPESFTFIESASVLAIVVMGGMGSQLGVVIAAAVVSLLPELGRALQDYRMLLFGLLMVLVIVWRPRGLLGGRDPVLPLLPKQQGGV